LSSTHIWRERLREEREKEILPVLADREGEVGAMTGLSKRDEAWASLNIFTVHM
jgi:hypothetical protein